jgi:hypothetical protein
MAVIASPIISVGGAKMAAESKLSGEKISELLASTAVLRDLLEWRRELRQYFNEVAGAAL